MSDKIKLKDLSQKYISTIKREANKNYLYLAMKYLDVMVARKYRKAKMIVSYIKWKNRCEMCCELYNYQI